MKTNQEWELEITRLQDEVESAIHGGNYGDVIEAQSNLDIAYGNWAKEISKPLEDAKKACYNFVKKFLIERPKIYNTPDDFYNAMMDLDLEIRPIIEGLEGNGWDKI